MFADIAGSTGLYDTLGDARAQNIVSRCLSVMSDICAEEGGILVKTIGDEVMCRFTSVDQAVRAACHINEHLSAAETEEMKGISVRIGLHFGQAIWDGQDLFGDAVNVAARMTAVARPRQIITTQETVNRLSSDIAATRFYDKATVRGKQKEILMYEVLWEQGDVTHVMPGKTMGPQVAAAKLTLRYAEREMHVMAGSSSIVMGRGAQCDLIVDSRLASRAHARIEYRRGKFVLVDQSRNGTFVKTQDGKVMYLRREELPLWGHGGISLGKAIEGDDLALISFFSQY